MKTNVPITEKPAIAISGGYVQANSVIHGDCLEVMRHISNESIDMILCDLPYGTTDCKWDIIIPFPDLWEQYERIIKQNGAIVLMAAQPFTSALVMSNIKLFRYDLTWDKVGVTGFLNAKKMPMRKHEDILIFYKKLPVYNPQKTIGKSYSKTRNKVADVYKKVNNYTSNNDGMMFPTSIIEIPKESCVGSNADRKEKSNHPTQKPVRLFEYLIKTYSNEGDLILDNCAGSGTTAESCLETKRKYILIEKEEKYVKAIEERILNVKRRLSERLF